jgi:hypothetical protein
MSNKPYDNWLDLFYGQIGLRKRKIICSQFTYTENIKSYALPDFLTEKFYSK